MKHYVMLLGTALITLAIGSLLIPISEGQDIPSRFPSQLVCQEAIVNEDADQPSWMGIKIGSSSLADLYQAIALFDYDYTVFQEPDTQRILFLTKLEDQGAPINTARPFSIQACLDGEIITALGILTVFQVIQPKLGPMILEKGVPDAVTWSDSVVGFRLLFWFEKGFMVEVHAPEFRAEGGEFSSIEVYRCVYFSPQSVEGYEDRWPYNRTVDAPEDLNPIDTLYSREQDPFRFDNFFATLTAQPEPTITPTAFPQLTPSAVDLTSQDLCP